MLIKCNHYSWRYLCAVMLLCCGAVLGAQILSPIFYSKAASAPANVPGMVQWTSGSNTKSGSALGTTVNQCATQTQCFSLPNAAQAGNTIVIFFTYSNTPASTPTCADDKSDTCTVIATANDTTNAIKLGVARILNVTSGARALTIAYGAAVTKQAPYAAEFYNVAATSADDTSSASFSASGSSTVQSGSLTPSVTGDLLVQCGVRSQTPAVTSFTVGSQSNITWSLIGTDLLDGLACQWGVYNSTSAINPQFTMASNSGYASTTIALKSGASGSARPAGMQIVGVQHEDVTDTIANTSPVPAQASCAGTENLIVMSGGFGQANYAPTGITDGASNTWASTGALAGNATSGKTTMWYAQNATCTAGMTISVATTGTGDASKDATMIFYYMVGAATSGVFSQRAGRSDVSAHGGTTYTFYDPLAPGVSSGIAIGNFQESQNTVTGATSPALIDSYYYGGENISGGHPPDENNGWFHTTFATSAQQTYTLTYADATNLGGQAYQVSFFAASGSSVTALASDTCTRANVGPPLSATVWGPGSTYSGFKVVSNACTPNSLALDDGVEYTAITWPNDQWSQATISALTGGTAGTDKGIGLMLRGSTSAHTEYRILTSNATGVNTWIEKFVAGTNTSVASGTASPAWAVNDIIYAGVVGTTITVKRGGSAGTTIISGTDSSIASGNPGLDYSSTMTTATLTNWSAGK